LHSQPDSEEGPDVVDLQLGIDRAVVALARSLGMVVDLEMIDGSTACGVLGAVNADVLILERWGDSNQGRVEIRSRCRFATCAGWSFRSFELIDPEDRLPGPGARSSSWIQLSTPRSVSSRKTIDKTRLYSALLLNGGLREVRMLSNHAH
jgi:hypothetical protein